MKNIYFIDNESIKRTAKIISKQNSKFKYTEILNNITQLLGYKDYNQYEHYLTNAILSKNSDLKNILALTKIDSINLVILHEKFKTDLQNLGYDIESIYFIKKIIDRQKISYLEHQCLDLNNYIYYLPFVLNDNYHNIFDATVNIKNGNLINIIDSLKSIYEEIGLDNLNNIISEVINGNLNDYLIQEINVFNKNLKTRGVYYYIKSLIENYEYDEGILTKLILKNYSSEQIEHEINLLIRCSQKDIIVFKHNKEELNNYFPFIRNFITQKNPFIFGKKVNQDVFFADKKFLYSNINLIGVPGSGKSAYIYTFLFQLLMNNRGFCVINSSGINFTDKYISHIANSLNKGNDIFKFNIDANIKSVANSIQNEKIIFLKTTDSIEHSTNNNVNDKFAIIIKELSEFYFTSNFRNKMIPFYIIIEDSHNLKDLSEDVINNIKKLNSLNIYFLFDNQSQQNNIYDICDTTIVTNSSIKWLTKSINFRFSKTISLLNSNKDILGINGISKDLPPVLSIIYKDNYIDQFITDVDYDLFEDLK